MSDELFELRNYFYLGNFAAAITEGETVSIDDEQAQIERDVILKRIQLSKGEYDAVVQSISDDAPPALQIVKLLASIRKDKSLIEPATAMLHKFAGDTVSEASPCFILMCAIAYAEIGDFDNALRTAHRAKNLEELSIKVHVLISMDRIDVAEKEVSAMQSIDEDATLTQLAAAWTFLAKGGESTQEALYVYQDLLERHGATDQILNGMALCHLAMGKTDEAEKVLNEALTKNPNCSTSLVNVICASKYKNKAPELVDRYFQQLTKVDPNNAWLANYRQKEMEFDSLAEEIAA